MTPRLETGRLLLRPLEPGDAPVIATLANNWNVAAMLSRMVFPYTRAHAEDFIARQVAAREEGHHVFAVTLDGGLIGVIGLHPQDDGRVELGYWLGEPFWGRGYATEAARAVVAFAEGALGHSWLVAGHFIDNPASGAVLEKAGFRYTHDELRLCAARGTQVLCREMERRSAAGETP